jgi:hypothetical protein
MVFCFCSPIPARQRVVLRGIYRLLVDVWTVKETERSLAWKGMKVELAAVPAANPPVVGIH